jgi:MFS family permease
LHVTLGSIAALGMSVTWVPCNATVARWFTRRRGSAVAVASTGGSLGNLLVPTLAAALVAAWGWRVTLAALAGTAALCMLVAARHMIRDPEAVGLWPDGAASAPPPSSSGSGRSLAEVRFTWPFVLVVAMYFMTWVPVFVPFVHAVAFAEDLGLGKIAAASVLTAIGAGGVVGRLASGWVSDRIGRLNSLLIVFAMQALAFIMFAHARDLDWLWAAAIVFGFSYGGTVTLLPPLCGDLFGRAHVAAIVGAIFALAGAPAAIGPYFAGWAYDASGSYIGAFYASAAFNLIACALAGVLLVLIAARRQAWHE